MGRPCLRRGENRGVGRLDGNEVGVSILGTQVAAHTRYGAAGAHAGNEGINLALGVIPDLRTSGLLVDLRVGLVSELGSQDSVRGLGDNLGCLLDGALHTSSARGEDDFSTVGAEQDLALVGHGLRHGQDHLVTLCGTDESQANTGVAGGGLNDGAARLELAGFYGGVDNRLGDAVLHGVGRVKGLDLYQHLSVEALGKAVEADERGAADGFQNVVVDSHDVDSFGNKF